MAKWPHRKFTEIILLKIFIFSLLYSAMRCGFGWVHAWEKLLLRHWSNFILFFFIVVRMRIYSQEIIFPVWIRFVNKSQSLHTSHTCHSHYKMHPQKSNRCSTHSWEEFIWFFSFFIFVAILISNRKMCSNGRVVIYLQFMNGLSWWRDARDFLCFVRVRD